jgi:hypothetical protein
MHHSDYSGSGAGAHVVRRRGFRDYLVRDEPDIHL